MTDALRPAAFLDRDGVLIPDAGYPHKSEHLILTEGAAGAVKALKDAGFITVIVTNQSGVARGMFSEEVMHSFNRDLIALLEQGGGTIDAIYHCPFHEKAVEERYRHPDHPDRKPNPGMLLRAAADHGLALDHTSLMIGDNESDMEAARRAGVRPYRFEGGNLLDRVRQILHP
jgi:D-glycero-D-manno-heptose 1,7-bisphosphate phosphatase